MFLRTNLLLAFTLFHSTSPAQESTTLNIKQIIESDRVIIAETSSNDEVEKNKVYLATFDNGSQCSMRVIETSRNIVPLDLSTCSRSGDLKVGQTLEPALYSYKRKTVSENTPFSEAQQKEANELNKNAIDRDPRSLGYTPSMGQTGIELSYTLENTELNLRVGTSSTNRKTRISRTDGRLFYGLSDSVALGLDMGVVLNRDTGYESTGENYISRGITDPTASIVWRLMDQSDQSSSSLFIHLGYSPSLVKTKSATDQDIGNAGKGCNATFAGLGLFKEFKSVEIGLRLQHFFCDAGSFEDATSGEKTEMEAQEETSISVEGKFDLNDQFSVISSLGYNSTPSTSQKDVSSGVSIRTSSYDTTFFSVGARFTLVPSKSFLDIKIRGESQEDLSISDGNTTVKVVHDTSSTLILALRTQF